MQFFKNSILQGNVVSIARRY